MGDLGINRSQQCRNPTDEVIVLVTGFGPFLDKYPVNSSWVTCDSLPETIEQTRSCPRIRIVKHREPIHVAYHSVAELVPRLLADADPHPDIVLHIGLAAKFGRRRFAMESQSQRSVYGKEKDVEGRVFSDEEDESLWHGYPKLLKPTFAADDVFGRWRDNIGQSDDIDVRSSDDPGNFLCGFIYYSTMAWYWERKQEGGEGERPVMFLHVPDLSTDDDAGVGRRVTIALIRALVESRRKQGVVDPLKGDGGFARDVPMGTAEL